MSDLERIGISLDKGLLGLFDELIRGRGYPNRSEAIRDLIRRELSQEELSQPDARAIAGIFLIYDHHNSNVHQKLIELQHNHLLEVITTIHVHLDHHNCLEIIILKGKVADISQLSDKITSMKGIKLSRNCLMTPGENLV
jgi:CopG family transcriptional regulator, nickel-responsive regulator